MLRSILNRKYIIPLLIVAVLLIFLKQCSEISKLKREVSQTEANAKRNLNNYKAARDSVRLLELSNGKKAATIKSYEFDVANLKDRQKAIIDNYDSLLDINNDLNKVNNLLSTSVEIRDSILATTYVEEVDSITDRLTFERDDNFGDGNTRYLKGNLTVFKNNNSLEYSSLNFFIKHNLRLYTSIEDSDNDGQDEVKITTSYPNLKITDIENINLVNSRLNQNYEETSGWSVGVGIGYGINLNNNQVISHGPSLNVGLFWSPKWLRF